MDYTELTQEDVNRLCSISKDTIKKSYAIYDLKHMIDSLHREKVSGIVITVGDRNFSVSRGEIPQVEALLSKCIAHLENDIAKRKTQIVNIVLKEELEES